MNERVRAWVDAALRRLTGWLWIAIWAGVLYLVAEPWTHLGGLVPERLRWLEWFVLAIGLLLGMTIGGFGRDAARPGSGRSHARLLRVLWLPQACLAALALVVLAWWGESDPIGIVLTAFLAYWAGLDLGFAALPLVQGRPYSFRSPIEPDPETWDGVDWDYESRL
ncbi:MAG: hypothetical protein ACYTGC_10490 [Planctomycetota bacterium]